eukprot:190057-Chlamydomonas_euryale.AAC.5
MHDSRRARQMDDSKRAHAMDVPRPALCSPSSAATRTLVEPRKVGHTLPRLSGPAAGCCEMLDGGCSRGQRESESE